MEYPLYIVVYIPTMGPHEFGNHFVLEFWFRYSTLCRLPVGMKAFYVQLLWFWLISFTWYIFVIFVLKLQQTFPSIDILFLILVALSQRVSTISCSLSDMCDVFDVFEVHLYTIR